MKDFGGSSVGARAAMQDAANEAQGVCEGFKSSGLVSSGGPL